jgi:hypothetical protein
VTSFLGITWDLEMQSSEFQKYFDSSPVLKNHFIGVFSIDTLPKVIKYRKFCICNTDVQSGNGKHWICFVRTCKNSIELFDSLGIDDEKKSLISRFCKFKVNEIVFNETQFQANFTSTCGLFVLYFIFERLFNLDFSFDEILNDIFDEDLMKNEEKVTQFCENILNDN